jgi:hypothetical protein
MADALGLKIRAAEMVVPDLGSFSNFLLDANNKQAAWVFAADSTDAITHLGHYVAFVTGTPPTYRISLQGVDSSGNPDGTVLGGGSPASVTFSGVSAGAWYWHALANAYVPTKGQILASVIDYSSGTINTSNRFSCTTHAGGTDFYGFSARWSFPYALQHNGTSWAKQTSHPIFGVRTAVSRYGIPLTSVAQTASITTSGHRAVMKFRVPSGGAISTYTIAQMRVFFDWPNSGSDIKFGIWNAAGTALQSETRPVSLAASTGVGAHDCVFATPATLSAGTWYYAGVEAAGTAMALYYQTVAESADKMAYNNFEAGGATWNGTTWTDQDTWLPAVELTLGEITPVGGGGSGVSRARVVNAGGI